MRLAIAPRAARARYTSAVRTTHAHIGRMKNTRFTLACSRANDSMSMQSLLDSKIVWLVCHEAFVHRPSY